jgi:hypothetical protein
VAAGSSAWLQRLVVGPILPSRVGWHETDLVVLARPEGFEHAPPTIVIEGVAELVEALRAA